MIRSFDLEKAKFDVALPANAPARLAPPPATDAGTWWQVGGATWVQALPRRSVQVKKPEENLFAQIRFLADEPGLASDLSEGWVWAVEETKALASDMVLGIRRQLDASVPALPFRANSLPPPDPQLAWPDGVPGRTGVHWRRRLEESAALASYLGQVEGDASERRDREPARVSGVAGRLIRHVSAIPRTAETRISLSWKSGDNPILSWDQRGNPELLWGVCELTFSELSRKVVTTRLPPEQADRQRRLGSCRHLFAMASAVEAATGGLSVPLQLRYRTACDRSVTANFTIAPGHWGFELPQMVLGARQGQMPEGVSFLFTG
jgi:hypothetical protein